MKTFLQKIFHKEATLYAIKNESGFSLVEIAIVMLIGGILLTTAAQMLMIYVKKNQINVTKTRLNTIDEALQDYLNLNGRLPCPAALDAAVDSAQFGIEVAANCSAGANAGTFRAAGRNGWMVRIGAVPVRTLNIPDDFSGDAWANRITYAVTESMATDGLYDRTQGAISVIDSAGNSVINPVDSAHYVLVSHGFDGAGAYVMEGVVGSACDAATLDGENCNQDSVFRRTMLMGTGVAASHYDDFVTIRALSAFGGSVPAGSVMAFNLAACPSGWVGFNESRGRVIIGTGDYSETYNPAGHTSWNYAHTYGLGETGGNATWKVNLQDIGLQVIPSTPPAAGLTNLAYQPVGAIPDSQENRPPYLALLYCQKT